LEEIGSLFASSNGLIITTLPEDSFAQPGEDGSVLASPSVQLEGLEQKMFRFLMGIDSQRPVASLYVVKMGLLGISSLLIMIGQGIEISCGCLSPGAPADRLGGAAVQALAPEARWFHHAGWKGSGHGQTKSEGCPRRRE
jgi:hypothetical protein